MADIFISYASEDRARVRPLAEALLARGFNIWWDRSLSAGQDYTAIIERELKSAKAVIVTWTQSSVHSTFVRDEAGRARDEGRLVPVLFDKVDIPLGFGSYQAEDFTNWNGGANAPQVQLLEEVLKAKLSGRDVDGAAIERRRRKLGARIRLVSLLTVVALVVGIAVGGRYLFDPPTAEVTQEDLRAELLRLLAEGKLTPEQAIQLASILESGALGETQMASNETPAGAAPAPTDAATMRSESEEAGVSEAQFDIASREAYRQAFLAVAQHPDAQIRLAAAQMSNPQARDAAMQTMWTYAQANPDDPLRDQIYLLCGTVGERNNLPLGQRALEASVNLTPRDGQAWRMLSRSYRRTNNDQAAQAAETVSHAVQSEAQGDTAAAEQQLQEAAAALPDPSVQATVVNQLGEIAVQRNDWTSASARFAQSYRLREQVAASEPNAPAAEGALEANAQQLVVALDRSGRTREACERLRQAQEEHNVAAPDQQILDRCQEEFRTRLQPRVELSPQLQRDGAVLRRAPSTTLQRAPVERVAPATP
ncbi:hypothetical protein U91I_03722 [alpha proteobacterium U9-1i]|nr:hypothetical protein U91I_03722 [alpha proteobacterium U9-1i]